MLHDLSKQVAHCYQRAAECNERATECSDASDKAFYLEREQAWLKLARSFELSERIGRVVNERQSRSQRLRNWPASRKTPTCPTCNIEMQLHAILPMLVDAAVMFEHAFFMCPNCGHLDNYLCD